MKSIIVLLVAAVLAVIVFVGLNTPNEKQAEKEMIPTEHKVVSVLHAVGSLSRSAISVAYLLLDNDSVVIYARNNNVALPFTEEEARIIMKVQRGDTVTITCFE